jgi:hypothetical protein
MDKKRGEHKKYSIYYMKNVEIKSNNKIKMFNFPRLFKKIDAFRKRHEIVAGACLALKKYDL